MTSAQSRGVPPLKIIVSRHLVRKAQVKTVADFAVFQYSLVGINVYISRVRKNLNNVDLHSRKRYCLQNSTFCDLLVISSHYSWFTKLNMDWLIYNVIQRSGKSMVTVYFYWRIITEFKIYIYIYFFFIFAELFLISKNIAATFWCMNYGSFNRIYISS